MLNPNLSGLNSPQTIVGGLTTRNVNPTPIGDNGDGQVATPNAVWIGDGDCNGDNWGYNSDVRPGDVVFFDNGAHRLCVGPDGEEYWAKTTVRADDFETDRGEIRRQ